MMRIGHGFDAHRLVAGRDLVLGGVTIPHNLGLLGHSDADVLVHAICDALLGALGAGDIGRHFPDTDLKYKGISSLRLLQEVMELVRTQGFAVSNIDATIIAQMPRLSPYIETMCDNIARHCVTEAARINIKATTTETLGFEGRCEGISSHAVVLLTRCSEAG